MTGRGRGRGVTKLYLNIDRNENVKPGVRQQESKGRLFQTTIFQRSVASIRDDSMRQQDSLTLQSKIGKDTAQKDKTLNISDISNIEGELKDLQLDSVQASNNQRKKKKEREWDRGKFYDADMGEWSNQNRRSKQFFKQKKGVPSW